MKKSDIYAESYTADPKDNSKALEAIKVHQMDQDRIRALGHMLREERAKVQELQRKLRRLEDEKRTLQEALNLKSHR